VVSYADEFNYSATHRGIKNGSRAGLISTRPLPGISESFGRAAVPISNAYRSEHNFQGVIDLIHMRAYTYEADGSGKATQGEIPAELKAAAESAREKIIVLSPKVPRR